MNIRIGTVGTEITLHVQVVGIKDRDADFDITLEKKVGSPTDIFRAWKDQVQTQLIRELRASVKRLRETADEKTEAAETLEKFLMELRTQQRQEGD